MWEGGEDSQTKLNLIEFYYVFYGHLGIFLHYVYAII